MIYNFSLNPLKASALFPLGTCPELAEGSKEGSLVGNMLLSQTPLSTSYSFPSLTKEGSLVFKSNSPECFALFPLGTCPELAEGSKDKFFCFFGILKKGTTVPFLILIFLYLQHFYNCECVKGTVV